MGWTAEQQSAIDTRDTNILVGAAAGSGKTAVLTERIAQIVCDEENKVDASRLLVLTFSNAAAAEMRQKTRKRLAARKEKEPDNAYIKSQYRKLARAQISTIHSFCSSLLREHFAAVDIAPDFTVAGDEYISGLTERAMEKTMEICYRDFPEEVGEVSACFGRARSDAEIFGMVKKLSDFRNNQAFPEKWSEKCLTTEEIDAADISRTEYFRYCTDRIKSGAGQALEILEEAKRELDQAKDTLDKPQSYGKYMEILIGDIDWCHRLLDACKAGDWDSVHEAAGTWNKVRMSTAAMDPEVKQLIKTGREVLDNLSSVLDDLPVGIYSAEDGAEIQNRNIKTGNLIFRMCSVYETTLEKMKQERRILTYDDLERLALKLLYNDDGTVTELSKHISECYDCIFVDEFQDTNTRQRLIFEAVSGGKKNLFYVGDVKQSIYGFRNADCRIFTEIKEKYETTGTDEGKYLALHSNFRSTPQVIDAVNLVFSPLMTKSIGGVDYTDGEGLTKGGKEGEIIPTEPVGLEYHALRCDTKSLADETAAYVKKLIEGGYQICDGESMRPCREEDICVVLSVAKKVAGRYQEAFAKAGIRSSAAGTVSFFEASEIMTVMSLIRIISNPLRNIDMVAVMMSPLFGFTPDEMAVIRKKRGYIWNEAVNSEDEKLKRFADKISSLRKDCAVMNVGEAVEHLVTETDAELLLTSPPDTITRKARLRAFIEYAVAYSPLESRDLGDFLRVCEKAAQAGKGPEVTVSSEPGVTITTIHKSKGLEWPIVILGDCCHGIRDEESEEAVFDESLGVSFKYRENTRVGAYKLESPSYMVSVQKAKQEKRSEYMRLFYVALTRAKQKIVVFGNSKDGKSGKNSISDKFSSALSSIYNGKAIPFIAERGSSFFTWMNIAFSVAGFIPDDTECDETSRGPFTLCCKSLVDDDNSTVSEVPEAERVFEVPLEELKKEVDERLAFCYPYASLSGIPTKVSVTELVGHSENPIVSRPVFDKSDALTAAERGTAVHRFMQICDYRNAASNPRAEIERIRTDRLMDERTADAVDAEKISDFFSSSLGKRAMKACEILREYAFIDKLPATVISGVDDTGNGETILVQGISDCILIEEDGAVLIDYKTDKVDNVNTLVSRYRGQLEMYKHSLEKRLGMQVKECIIWSFYLSESVKL